MPLIDGQCLFCIVDGGQIAQVLEKRIFPDEVWTIRNSYKPTLCPQHSSKTTQLLTICGSDGEAILFQIWPSRDFNSTSHTRDTTWPSM